jgi:hypothetical protein
MLNKTGAEDDRHMGKETPFLLHNHSDIKKTTSSESLFFFHLNVLWRRTSACNKDNVSVLNNLYREKN